MSAVPLSRPKYIESDAIVQFQFSTITVPPNATRPILVRFNPPHTTQKHLIYGGYLQIQADDEKIHVPYFGATDNQHDLPLFDIVVKCDIICGSFQFVTLENYIRKDTHGFTH